MSPAYRRQLGFSLIELVIFIVVVGIAATAVMQAFSQGLAGAGMEDEAIRASQLGQQRMELVLGQKRGGEIDFEELAETCDEIAPPDGWTVPDDYVVEHECTLEEDEADVAWVVVEVIAPDGDTYAYVSRIHDLSQAP